ncbi:proline--tRNA ligase [Candidatus Parcubacteria bacterium]|nr:proline--tRNA ligase [Candidatus Parcubacteria bacterium]
MAFDNKLPQKSTGLSDWYNKAVLRAELADYGPAKGTMIFRPYGYGVWELVQQELDAKIRARGVENAYFPLLIPESLLNKEKDHVEGFAPELAVVTIGGGEQLEEKLAVRPTSETIMYEAYARWIQSWRDLPVMINQWNNVVRWEKRTYLFLRTSEFLWQEGHTAHAEHKEAVDVQSWAMKTYEALYRQVFALPGYVGKKSEAEKFAGARQSLTYETLMPEGKALQSSTSHDLGQNFAKAFDIKYQDRGGKMQHVWQTSWGLSTRSLGGLIMAHGDDKGLRLPPKLAPIQVIIVPVKMEAALLDYCDRLEAVLRQVGCRVRVDTREDERLGFKINKWELKGVPLRIEIGQQEMESDKVTVARRDTGEKLPVLRSDVALAVPKLLDEIQAHLYHQAEQFLRENTHEAVDYHEFKRIMAGQKGFLRAFWCEDSVCEAKIKEETTATTRCLPLDSKPEKGVCVYCGKSAGHRWLFAQAY